MTKFLLIFVFFTLPLIHGKLLPTIGIPFSFDVTGNFEFTKSMFFNIFSGIIFLSFFIESLVYRKKNVAPFPFERERIQDRVIIGIIFLILLLSTLFSTSPFISTIGDTEKGHTALLFFNLLGIFIVLKNQEISFLKKLIITSLISGFFASFLAIKELYFPSYDYGELSTRALGSFGHPNYLAGFLLLLFPFICSSYSTFSKQKIQVMRTIGCIIFIITIFFTKSLWAIFLIFCYIFYSVFSHHKKFLTIFLGFFSVISLIFLIKYSPEKLHSFLSRFYLWETTLKIIFSDIRIFLLGSGAEMLPYYFDSFKVPEVYIYENIGYTADRPHNFFLNVFFHFGVFALGVFIYLIYKFGKNTKNTPEYIAILLFLLFGIFHFFSITSYVYIILLCSIFLKGEKNIQEADIFGNIIGKITLGIIFILSLTGSYYSFKLFQSEILYKQKNYSLAQENFSHPRYLIELQKYEEASQRESLTSQLNFREQLILSKQKNTLCDELLSSYPSAENYLYCGKLLEGFGYEDEAKYYYKKGLEKLPDLWNKDSPYWDNYFIKNTITGNRFFSEKFSDISEVLKIVEK